MVQLSRRQLLAAAGAAAVAGVAGCSDDGDAASADLDSKRAGAMEGFKAGDQFKATEPLKFPIML